LRHSGSTFREDENRSSVSSCFAEGGDAGLKTIRAFIAVEISKPLKVPLRKMQDCFRGRGDRIGWVKPAGMHLTLKFLGKIEEGMIAPVGERIGQACQEQDPFLLRLIGIGVFPGFKRPRVLWVGVGEGAEKLREIFETLDPLLGEIGFPTGKKDFHHHVTLGRIKKLHNRLGFVERVKENKMVHVGEMKVEAVRLIESRLRPGGADYRDRFVVSLEKRVPDTPGE